MVASNGVSWCQIPNMYEAVLCYSKILLIFSSNFGLSFWGKGWGKVNRGITAVVRYDDLLLLYALSSYWVDKMERMLAVHDFSRFSCITYQFSHKIQMLLSRLIKEVLPYTDSRSLFQKVTKYSSNISERNIRIWLHLIVQGATRARWTCYTCTLNMLHIL